jgi:hypothetical protein
VPAGGSLGGGALSRDASKGADQKGAAGGGAGAGAGAAGANGRKAGGAAANGIGAEQQEQQQGRDKQQQQQHVQHVQHHPHQPQQQQQQLEGEGAQLRASEERLCSHAEASALDTDAAAAAWSDGITISALLRALTAPQAPQQQAAWLRGAPLRRLVAAAARLLPFGDGARPEAPALQSAVVGVARAAAAVQAREVLMHVLECLKGAESAAARHMASIGYAFVTYQEAAKLYCELLATRPAGEARGEVGGEGGAWAAAGAAAGALADALTRAQVCVAGGVRGPALRAAEDLLQFALGAQLAARLCACVQDGYPGLDGGGDGSAAAAAAEAARALAALVQCPAVRLTSSSWLEHFPLAQALSSKAARAQDRGLDVDNALVDGVRSATAQALAANPAALAALAGWAQRRLDGGGGGGGAADACVSSLQVLHHCCRASATLSEAVLTSGTHKVLLALATSGTERDPRAAPPAAGSGVGPGGAAALAALALASAVAAVAGRAAAGGAAPSAGLAVLAPSGATDAAICRLAGAWGWWWWLVFSATVVLGSSHLTLSSTPSNPPPAPPQNSYPHRRPQPRRGGPQDALCCLVSNRVLPIHIPLAPPATLNTIVVIDSGRCSRRGRRQAGRTAGAAANGAGAAGAAGRAAAAAAVPAGGAGADDGGYGGRAVQVGLCGGRVGFWLVLARFGCT